MGESPPFDRRLIFQFLDEVAMPVQPRTEAAHPTPLEFTAALQHFPHGEAAPGYVSGSLEQPLKARFGRWNGSSPEPYARGNH